MESSWGGLADFVNERPKWGVSVLWAICKCRKTRSRHSICSNKWSYQANDAKPTTRNQDTWWLGLVVCNATRGAAESHYLVFQKIYQLHRQCPWWSVFLSSQRCKIHFIQCMSNSDYLFSIWQASSLYGSLCWVHRADKSYATKQWYSASLDGDETA